ncbi:AraC family transcriptional regulator [Williamsia sp. 1135]|uniref:AraC family transcriptional regulator n=1 Tax=Williamsia sp. 1135 TaxID=1889262 RepID=UPI00117C3214|nr:AraC family transcriptional regulator [Williamsia sp. 1135]
MTENPYRLAANAATVEPDTANESVEDFFVTRDVSDGGLHFEPHRHDTDELMWAREGRLDVRFGGRNLSLHHGHMAWIPAQVTHEATLLGDGELMCLFADTRLRPPGDRFREPHVVAASSLMGTLVHHLRDLERPRAERRKTRELLTELIATSDVREDTLAVPRDSRAAIIADELLANPADQRTLVELAESVQISPRTLARIFIAETGLSLGKWRSKARLNHSLTLLKQGHSVEGVAAGIGYRTTSSFIETFRNDFGLTRAAYRRRFLV